MCALLVTSCTHEKPKQPALTWENKDRTTMRWIPNPVADLMFPEGTFVRAITESFTAAQSGPGEASTRSEQWGTPASIMRSTTGGI